MIIPKNRCTENIKNKIDRTNGLIALCQKIIKKNMIGVEIGSFAGISSEVFALFAKKIICIDGWDMSVEKGGYLEVKKSGLLIAESKFDKIKSKYENIVKIKNLSVHACNDFESKSLDFVYIDGNHTYDFVMQDIKIWKPKIKENGFLLGHDYILKSVSKALNDSKIPVLKIFDDSSWVAKISNKKNPIYI